VAESACGRQKGREKCELRASGEMDRVASQPKNKAATHIEGGGGVSCYGQSCTDICQPSAQPQNHTANSAKRHHDLQKKAHSWTKNGGGHPSGHCAGHYFHVQGPPQQGPEHFAIAPRRKKIALLQLNW